MDHNGQQQQEEQRRREEEECACTPTTDLFALCPACYDKAWHYGHVMRKRENVRNDDYMYAGDEYYFRTTGGYYVNIHNDTGQDEVTEK